MCLAVISTDHPDYAYVVISNRDEFVNRPTLNADWWSDPHQHVLGGRDLQNASRGTWLGITKQGRFALLTNYREEDFQAQPSARSRGDIVKSFLTVPVNSNESPEGFAKRLVDIEGVQGMGGFTLIFGELLPKSHPGHSRSLCIISNRTKDSKEIIRIPNEETRTYSQACALSNANFGNREWPKVVLAQNLLDDAIKKSSSLHETSDEFVQRCLDILSTNKMPPRRAGNTRETYFRELRNTIFVPPIPAEEGDDVSTSVLKGAYGTQKQTIILVSHSGVVDFRERTLFKQDGEPLPPSSRDRQFTFVIDNWTRNP